MTGANGLNGVKAPKPTFPAEAATREYAVSLDKADPLRALRDEFIIPSKANLASKKLAKPGTSHRLVDCGVYQGLWLLTFGLQVFPPSLVSTSAVIRWAFSPRRQRSTWRPN